MKKFLIVIFVIILFSTCKSLPQEEPEPPLAPIIGAHVMRVEARNSTSLEWFISVNVENHNSFELPPPKVTFNYKVYDTSIIRSRFEHRQPLAANSSTPIYFGILVYYADVFRVIPALRYENDASSVLELTFDFILPEFKDQVFELKIPATLILPSSR